MATTTGSGGVVTVAGNTIAEILGFSYETSVNPIDDSNLNAAAATAKAGRFSWSGSVEAHWDATDTLGQNSMVSGNTMAFIFYLDGNASGKPTVVGTALITSTSTAVADESIVSQSFSLQGVGALTYGTVA